MLQGQPKRNETENARRKIEGTYLRQANAVGLSVCAQVVLPPDYPRGDDSTGGKMQPAREAVGTNKTGARLALKMDMIKVGDQIPETRDATACIGNTPLHNVNSTCRALELSAA